MGRAFIIGVLISSCASPPEPSRPVGKLESALTAETFDLNLTGARDFEFVRTVKPSGGRAFGSVVSRQVGWERLFVTDGTGAGTRIVTDVHPPNRPGFVRGLRAGPNGSLFFIADDGAFGRELWRTDGTAAGTERLTDCAPGALDAFPDTLYAEDELALVDGGVVLGCAFDGQSRPALVDFAGHVTPLLAPDAGAEPSSFRRLGNRVFFVAEAAGSGSELYVTDGTPAGTHRVAELLPGLASGFDFLSTFSPDFVETAGHVFFVANGLEADGGSVGGELFVTDGTAAGTRLVKDVRPGPFGSGITQNLPPSFLIPADGGVFFFASDAPPGLPAGLWFSDGTEAGTISINPVATPRPVVGFAGSGYTDCGRPRPLWLGDTFFFPGNSGQLWASDGTPMGTRGVGVLVQSTGNCAGEVLGGSVIHACSRTILCSTDGGFSSGYFSEAAAQWTGDFAPAGSVLVATGDRLWATGGTAASTQRLDGLTQPAPSSRPRLLTAFAPGVAFVASTPEAHLYVTDDGGAPAPRDVFDADGGAAAELIGLASLHGNLIGASARGLTRLGPAGPTTLSSRPILSPPRRMPAVGDQLFVHSCDFATDALWVTDGTVTGTHAVAEVTGNGRCNGNFTPLVTDGLGVFSVLDAGMVWTNGTTLEPVPTVSAPELLTSGDGGIWFSSQASLWHAWRRDAGAFELTSLGQTPVAELIEWRAAAYFSDGLELHRTLPDAGLALLADIWPGAGASKPMDFIACGDSLFFSAVEPGVGRELWKTDGTAMGTARVAELWPGTGSGFVAAGLCLEPEGALVFSGADPANGAELWVTRGTAASTRRVTDLASGAGHAYPEQLVRSGPWIYFSAYDAQHGTEPRRLAVAEALGGMGPALTCPEPEAIEATGPLTPASFPPAIAPDATTVTYSLDAGVPLPPGETTVEVTATDVSGNVSSCVFTLAVEDRTPPVVTCPASFSVRTSTPNAAIVDFAPGSATDAVGPVTVVDAPPSGSTFRIGATTVTRLAVDGAGNSERCTFVVTVVAVDSGPPPGCGCTSVEAMPVALLAALVTLRRRRSR